MGTPFAQLIILFGFSTYFLQRQQKYTICENFNCLPIGVLVIQPTYRRTDRETDSAVPAEPQKHCLKYMYVSQKHLKVLL